MIYRKTVPAALLLIIFILSPLSAQRTKSSLNAGEQRHAEKSLKDNRYFIKFINPSVSNRSEENATALFTEAVRRDLLGRILYMKFSFHNAFSELKKSQILMIKLYRIIIANDVKNSKKLLNEAAPEILRKKEHYPRKYLSLGYRSSRWAEKTMIMADNLPETNYSIRLYQYVRAVKRAKYARRYALIALIESRLEPEKKRKMKYNSYKAVRGMIDRYLPESKERFQAVHLDNYYLTGPENSVYEKIMQHPELEKIPEYSDYLKDEQ